MESNKMTNFQFSKSNTLSINNEQVLSQEYSTKIWSVKSYLYTSFAGTMRSLIGLPFEHPLELIKTKLQSSISKKSGAQVAKEIYLKNGLIGLYAGLIPNTLRLIFKQVYRYPLLFLLPNFFKRILPEHYEKEKRLAKKTLAGFSIALLEVYILCPLERLKVYLMTKKQFRLGSLINFIKQNKKILKIELFRGLNALFPKQIISWVSFLTTDYKLKIYSHTKFNIPFNEVLPYYFLISIGIFVGLVNVTVTLPFDFVKTQFQMQNHIENSSLRIAFSKFKNEFGLFIFYKGWCVRMIQSIIHCVFTVSLIEKLEKN